MTQKAVVAKDDVDGEDGVIFELNQLNNGKKKNTRDLAKFCNLLCNLPFLPSPKIRQVNYIILYFFFFLNLWIYVQQVNLLLRRTGGVSHLSTG